MTPSPAGLRTPASIVSITSSAEPQWRIGGDGAQRACNDGMDSSRSLSRHHCRELWVAPRNQEEAEMNAMTVAVDLAKDVFEVAVANRAGRIVERKRLRSEEHTSELQSQSNLVCRLLLEKK